MQLVRPATPYATLDTLIPVAGSAHSIKHSIQIHYIEQYIEYSINRSMLLHNIEQFIEWIVQLN